MGGGTNTTTTNQNSSSTPANPNVTNTLNQLLTGVQGSLAKGSTFTGAGPTTQTSWIDALNQANDPTYQSGVQGALQSQAGVAAGNDLGQNDPGYAALRNTLSNNVLTSTNAAFNNSGLFGSDNNQTAAAQGLTQGLGGLDYQQYQDSLARQNNAISQLPGLYQASLAPSATQAAVGSAQDVNTQGAANGQNSLLAQLSSILGGIGGLGGTNTTGTATQQTPTTPLWQSLLGLGIQAL